MSPFIASHNSLLGSKAAVKRAGLVQTSLGSPWQPALQEPFLPFPPFLFCCCCCCVIKTSRIESPPGCSAGTAPDLLPASSQLPSPFLIPWTSKPQTQPSKAQSKLSPSPATAQQSPILAPAQQSPPQLPIGIFVPSPALCPSLVFCLLTVQPNILIVIKQKCDSLIFEAELSQKGHGAIQIWHLCSAC